MPKTILVTGASTGFGRRISETLAGAGHTVFASMRNTETGNAGNAKALRDAGLGEEEIVDLILSASLFGWANRLMHILGDPVR